jgi:hypothetical protein
LSALSIFLLVVSLIIQRRTTLEIQKRAEQVSFELKAAEILMDSQSPWDARRRLAVITDLYGDRLRTDFSTKFDTEKFPGKRIHGLRQDLAESMASKVSTKEEVIQVFRFVYNQPDSWMQRDYPPEGE